jgi:hypothetical protein
MVGALATTRTYFLLSLEIAAAVFKLLMGMSGLQTWTLISRSRRADPLSGRLGLDF